MPPDRDLLGRVRIEDQRIDLYLQRVPRGDGVDIWKIASISTKKIPDLYRYFGYWPIGEVLSRTLPYFEILGLKTWQWLLVIGLLVAGYLIALVPTWVIAWFLHLRGSANEAELLKFLGGPLRLMLAVLIARSGVHLIHPRLERIPRKFGGSSFAYT